jgi:Holliday junction resolvase RusA-like endonuclease
MKPAHTPKPAGHGHAARPVVLVVPFAAMHSVNGRTIPVHGWQVLSPEYRAALTEARLLIRKQWRGPAWTCDLALTIRLYWPDARRRDESNYLKLLEDALMPTAIVDDHQITDTRAIRAGIDRLRPRGELELVPAGWSDPATLPPEAAA